MSVDRSTQPKLLHSIASAKRALTVAEVAALLHIHKLTVYRLATAGTIPHFRIGSCIRFDPTTLAEYLRQHEVR